MGWLLQTQMEFVSVEPRKVFHVDASVHVPHGVNPPGSKGLGVVSSGRTANNGSDIIKDKMKKDFFIVKAYTLGLILQKGGVF